MCALRWTDIDADDRTLAIARSLHETAGGGWAEKGTETHQVRTIGPADLAPGIRANHQGQVDDLARGLRPELRPDGFVFSHSPVGAEPVRPDLVTKFAEQAAPRARAGVDTTSTRCGTSPSPRPSPPVPTRPLSPVAWGTATRRSPSACVRMSSESETRTWPLPSAGRCPFPAERTAWAAGHRGSLSGTPPWILGEDPGDRHPATGADPQRSWDLAHGHQPVGGRDADAQLLSRPREMLHVTRECCRDGVSASSAMVGYFDRRTGTWAFVAWGTASLRVGCGWSIGSPRLSVGTICPDPCPWCGSV